MCEDIDVVPILYHNLEIHYLIQSLIHCSLYITKSNIHKRPSKLFHRISVIANEQASLLKQAWQSPCLKLMGTLVFSSLLLANS